MKHISCKTAVRDCTDRALHPCLALPGTHTHAADIYILTRHIYICMYSVRTGFPSTQEHIKVINAPKKMAGNKGK